MSHYSVVIPVYKNEDSLPLLVEQVRKMNERLQGNLEAIFVIDGSPDKSFSLLTQMLPENVFRSKVLALSRNFGSFAAIRAGLRAASGPFFAVMAADLQDPPDLILNFFEILDRDEADVVVGTRIARQDPVVSIIFSRLFWWFYRRVIQPETPKGGIDVFGCNKSFRDQLVQLDESHSSLIGLLLWLGFRRKSIPYQRLRRPHGRSSWTVRRKLRYLSDSAFSFSNLPIQALFWLGFFGLVVSIIFAAIVLWARLTGRIQVTGYSPVVLAITFFGSLNLVSLGIIGSYLWRAFENTKQRPNAIVMRELTFEPKVK
jgi:glycosyltransferase involved in cell wall biosynthesis